MAGGHEDHVAAGSDSRPASAFDGLAAGLSGLGNHSPAVPLGRHDNPERLLPGLHDEERLPWLDADEGFAEDAGADARRMWAVVLSALALLMVIGGVWWTVHRRNEAALTADGSLIRKAGVMGIVRAGGTVQPGDHITVALPEIHRPLAVV